MRTVLDGVRVLRSVLGFVGHYRAASAVGLILAVAWFVFGFAGWAHADECVTNDQTVTAGCGSEDRPYVVKPKGTEGLLVRPEQGQPFTVDPKTGAVFEVAVTNWPAPSESTTASEVALTTEQMAFFLLVGSLLVGLQATSTVLAFGRA